MCDALCKLRTFLRCFCILFALVEWRGAAEQRCCNENDNGYRLKVMGDGENRRPNIIICIYPLAPAAKNEDYRADYQNISP